MLRELTIRLCGTWSSRVRSDPSASCRSVAWCSIMTTSCLFARLTQSMKFQRSCPTPRQWTSSCRSEKLLHSRKLRFSTRLLKRNVRGICNRQRNPTSCLNFTAESLVLHRFHKGKNLRSNRHARMQILPTSITSRKTRPRHRVSHTLKIPKFHRSQFFRRLADCRC